MDDIFNTVYSGCPRSKACEAFLEVVLLRDIEYDTLRSLREGLLKIEQDDRASSFELLTRELLRLNEKLEEFDPVSAKVFANDVVTVYSSYINVEFDICRKTLSYQDLSTALPIISETIFFVLDQQRDHRVRNEKRFENSHFGSSEFTLRPKVVIDFYKELREIITNGGRDMLGSPNSIETLNAT
ncbi:MAG: hypothetical protein NZO16_07055, partial [Deltaproteobacteria bacterium]|nr:hypothetical protein [Deltaproteobacteria bacterium]